MCNTYNNREGFYAFVKSLVKKERRKTTSVKYPRLVLTTDDEFGWIIFDGKSTKICFDKEHLIPAETCGKKWKEIECNTYFIHKNAVWRYYTDKASTRHWITPVTKVINQFIAEEIFPGLVFKPALLLDKNNQEAVNAVFVASSGHKKIMIHVLQKEIKYNPRQHELKELHLNDEFRMNGSNWFMATEKGKPVFCNLP